MASIRMAMRYTINDMGMQGNMREVRALFVSSIFFFLMLSCSLTTLQSPKPMEPGKAMFGIDAGLGGISDPNSGIYAELAICSRFGIIRNLDTGLKLGLPYFFFYDIKYQIVHKPIVSASLGLSYMPKTDVAGVFSSSDVHSWFALYPTLMIGRESSWFGFKCPLVYDREFEGNTPRLDTYLLPGIMIGQSGTGRTRFMGELNVYYRMMQKDKANGVWVALGFGLHFGH